MAFPRSMNLLIRKERREFHEDHGSTKISKKITKFLTCPHCSNIYELFIKDPHPYCQHCKGKVRPRHSL